LGLVLGPLWAGLVFDHLGFTAPYWTCGFWVGVGLLLALPALKQVQFTKPTTATSSQP